jgi:hypothetical protein
MECTVDGGDACERVARLDLSSHGFTAENADIISSRMPKVVPFQLQIKVGTFCANRSLFMFPFDS